MYFLPSNRNHILIRHSSDNQVISNRRSPSPKFLYPNRSLETPDGLCNNTRRDEDEHCLTVLLRLDQDQ